MAKSSTSTEWRAITVDDRRTTAARSHVVAVEDLRESLFLEEVRPPRLESAKILLTAYLVSDGRRAKIATMGGTFQWGMDCSEYKLTGGSMIVDPEFRGLHIGSYLQNEVVRWAKDVVQQPGLIRPITVSAQDALDANERDRRNRFYEQFGITFDWTTGTNLERSSGRSASTLTIDHIHSLAEIAGVRSVPTESVLATYVHRAKTAEALVDAGREGIRQTRTAYERKLTRWRRSAFVCAALGLVGYALWAITKLR